MHVYMFTIAFGTINGNILARDRQADTAFKTNGAAESGAYWGGEQRTRPHVHARLVQMEAFNVSPSPVPRRPAAGRRLWAADLQLSGSRQRIQHTQKTYST